MFKKKNMAKHSLLTHCGNLGFRSRLCKKKLVSLSYLGHG